MIPKDKRRARLLRELRAISIQPLQVHAKGSTGFFPLSVQPRKARSRRETLSKNRVAPQEGIFMVGRVEQNRIGGKGARIIDEGVMEVPLLPLSGSPGDHG